MSPIGYIVGLSKVIRTKCHTATSFALEAAIAIFRRIALRLCFLLLHFCMRNGSCHGTSAHRKKTYLMLQGKKGTAGKSGRPHRSYTRYMLLVNIETEMNEAFEICNQKLGPASLSILQIICLSIFTSFPGIRRAGCPLLSKSLLYSSVRIEIGYQER